MTEDTKLQFLAQLENAISALEAKLPQTAPYVRPFICDGDVTECNVFIVGTNPRENMPFRPFWDGRHFDKRDWERHYLWKRYAGGLWPCPAGTRYPTRVSRVRKKLDVFCRAAAPCRVLEVNIYPIATRTEAELESHSEYKETAIFDLLWEALRPRFVLLHGRAVRTHREPFIKVPVRTNMGAAGVSLKEYAVWTGSPTTAVAALDRHLGRAGNMAQLIELGKNISDFFEISQRL